MAEEDRAPEAPSAADADVAVTPTELVDTAETVGDDHDHAEGRGLPVARLLAGLVGTTELADGAVTTPKLADGAVTDVKMANQKVNWVNPRYGTFGAVTDKGSGFFDVDGSAGDAPVGGHLGWLVVQNRHWNTGVDYRVQLAFSLTDPNECYVRSVVAGAGQPWRKVWHAGNDSQIANLVRTNTSSDITGGSLVISGGGLTVSGGNIALGTTRQIVFPQETGVKINLTATNGQYGFQLDTATLILNTNRFISFHNEAAGAGSYSVTFDTQTHAATFLGTITAAGLAGAAAAQFATAGHTHPPGALVPSGLVAAVRTAGEIPSGWTRETLLDGRVMVGAGAAGGASFTETSDYGSTWVRTFGSDGPIPAGGAVQAGSGSTAAPAPHSHNITDISFVPPSKAYVFVRKS